MSIQRSTDTRGGGAEPTSVANYDGRIDLGPDSDWDGLPGAELVRAGIDDLRAGRETESAMLVALAAERLRAAGMDLPQTPTERPWHRLYDILNRSDARNAHSRYNALLRRIASFARAAEHASSR